MFPLGVLKKEQVGGSVSVLSMVLSSDFTDSSVYNTQTSTISGTPTFSGGSLFIDDIDKIRTGTSNNQPQSHLNLYNKLYEISFDVKMVSAGYPTVVLQHSSKDMTGYGCQFSIDSTANTVVVTNVANAGVFTTHSLGFDSKAAFFNVKLKRTGLESYELLINNVVVKSVSAYGSGVMDDNSSNTDFHGFRIGQGSPRPFYLKNLLVTVSNV